MKKSFLLIMCLLLAIALVACNKNANKTDDTTAADTTAAVETPAESESSENTTVADEATTDEAGSSEETTTEEETTTGLVVTHTHTFKTEWSADDNGHWHEASCEHSVEKSEQGAHVDADADDECDVCGYDLACEHELSSDLEGIAAGHYHLTNCEHDLILDLTAHTGTEDGTCDACGYSFDELIDDITSTEAANRVNGGTIAYAGQYETKNITYKLGFGFLYMDENTEYSYDAGVIENTKHSVHLFNNGNVFYLKEAYEMVSREDYEITADNVAGFKFSSDMFFYISLDDSDPCGAENLLYSFYTYAKTNAANNLTLTWGETNVITFAQGDDYSAKLFTVEFVISETGVITSLKLTSKNFYGPDYDDMGQPIAETVKYTIDDNGVITFVDGAEADVTVTVDVAQTEGSREDIKSSYNLDEIIVNSYDIMNGETVMGDTINLEVGASVTLTYANLNPTTANLELDKITATIYDETGSETWNVNVYASGEGVYVTPYKAGNYVLKLTTLNTEKTYVVVVTKPTTTEIYAAVDNYGIKEAFTEKTVYVNSAFAFVALAQNNYADATFTAEITSGTGATLTVLDTADGYSFLATETGTYVVTLTSIANPSVTNTVTFIVTQAVDTSKIFKGTWENSTYGIIVEITPTDATSGTYTLTMNNSTVQFAYTLNGTTIDAMPIAGGSSNWSVAFDENFNLQVVNAGGMGFSLEQTSTGEEVSGNTFEGTYTGDLDVMGTAMSAKVVVTGKDSFTFEIDGTTTTYYFSINAETGYLTTIIGNGNPPADFIFRYISDMNMLTVEMVHPMTGYGMEIGALAKSGSSNVGTTYVMDGKYKGVINVGDELEVTIDVEEKFDTMTTVIDGISTTYAYSIGEDGILTTMCVGGEQIGDFQFQYIASDDVIVINMFNPRLGYYAYAGDAYKVVEEEPAGISIDGIWTSADGCYYFSFEEAAGTGTVDFSSADGEWLKIRGFTYTMDAEGNIAFTSIKGNLSGYMDWSTNSTAKYVDGAIILTLDTGVEVVLSAGNGGW